MRNRDSRFSTFVETVRNESYQDYGLKNLKDVEDNINSLNHPEERLFTAIKYMSYLQFTVEKRELKEKAIFSAGKLTQLIYNLNKDPKLIVYILEMLRGIMEYKGVEIQMQENISDFLELLIKQIGNDQITSLAFELVRKLSWLDNNLVLSNKMNIMNKFREKLEENLEILDWRPESLKKDVISRNLKDLLRMSYEPNSRDFIFKGIIKGRFGKGEFGLTRTIIIGDNDGLYLMLHKKDDETTNIILESGDISNEYLTKITDYENNIIVGAGAFGKVRLALCLTEDDSNEICQIVCVKKSKSLEKIENEDKSYDSLSLVTDTIEEYLGKVIAEKLRSPLPFDMTIVHDLDNKKKHYKGYVLIEFFPESNSDNLFKNDCYQLWIYQKPYFLDICRGALTMLYNNIFISDLKPGNIIFDPLSMRIRFVDLGTSVLITNGDTPTNFSSSKYNIPSTRKYTSPEVYRQSDGVNLERSLSYTCGQIIRNVCESTNCNKHISNLISRMTSSEPHDRLPINEAIRELENIDAGLDIKGIISSHYIETIKKHLSDKSKGLYTLNNYVLREQEIFIEQYVTDLNPLLFVQQEAKKLDQVLESFLNEDAPGIFLLLGEPGSGKSIALQKKFVECIENWNEPKPLPFYLNMANSMNIECAVDDFNKRMKTNLKLGDHQIVYFIDSFDEGPGIETNNSYPLLQDFETKPGWQTRNLKLIITCRSNFFHDDNELKSFSLKDSKLTIKYITPLMYKDTHTLEGLIESWACLSSNSHVDIEKIAKKIKNFNLGFKIQTSFMFAMTLAIIDEIEIDHSNEAVIYKNYINHYMNKHLGLLDDKQLRDLREFTSEVLGVDDLSEYLMLIGQKISEKLLTEMKSNMFLDLTAFDEFFGIKDKAKRRLNRILVAQALKLLPIKFEFNKKKNLYLIGFMHETIKNKFILFAIKNSLKAELKFSFLKNRNILKDYALLKYLASEPDNNFKESLKTLIYETRLPSFPDERESAAAVAITILVMTRCNFSYQNLSSIRIKGANLRGGIFENSNFSYANLENVCLSNTRMNGAIFYKTNLKNVKLGIDPDIYYNNGPIQAIAFNPKGDRLIAGFSDNSVKIFNLIKREWENFEISEFKKVKTLAFSSDGKFLLSSSWDHTILFWDNDNQIINCNGVHMKAHSKQITSIAASRKGDRIISGSKDNLINIWDATSRELLFTIKNIQNYITSVDISYDGKYFISGSADNKVRLWKMNNYQQKHTLSGHEKPVSAVKFNPRENTFASAGEEGVINIWSKKGYHIKKLFHGGKITCIDYSPDGNKIASGSMDCSIKVWDSRSSVLLFSFHHYRDVKCLAFHPTQELLVSSSSDKTIKFWRTELQFSLLSAAGHIRPIITLAFSHNGRMIATGSEDNNIIIWDVIEGKEICYLRGHVKSVTSVQFSPYDKYLLSTSKDFKIKVWDLLKNSCYRTLNEHGLDVVSLAFSPNGETFATASWDGTIKTWDFKNLECLGNFHRLKETITSLQYTPDGTHIVSSLQEGLITFINIDTKIRKTLENQGGCLFAFNKDGSLLASGTSCQVKVWCTNTFEEKFCFEGHKSIVLTVVFSPSERILVSGSADNTIRVWDLDKGKCNQILTGYSGWITGVLFSPNGSLLAGVSFDKSLKIWRRRAINNKSSSIVLNEYAPKIKMSASNTSQIVTSSYDGSIRIWRLDDLKLSTKFLESKLPVNYLGLSEDGTLLAVSFSKDSFLIWNLQNYSLLKSVKVNGKNIKKLSFTKNNKIICYTYEGEISLWSPKVSKTTALKTLFVDSKINKLKTNTTSDEELLLHSVFCLEHHLSREEQPLIAQKALILYSEIDNANEKAIKQRGAKIETDNLSDDIVLEGELTMNSRSNINSVNFQTINLGERNMRDRCMIF